MRLRLSATELGDVRLVLAGAGHHGPLLELTGGYCAAVYAGTGFVARIRKEPEPLRGMLHARYLAWSQLCPVAVATLSGPVQVGELTVTVYERAHPVGWVDGQALGAALRAVHDTPLAVVSTLPPALVLSSALHTLTEPAAVAALSRRERTELDAQLRAAADQLVGPAVVSHGDCWPKSWVCTSAGPRLIDPDTAGPSPALHDLSMLVVGLAPGPHHDPTFPTVDIAALADGYGIAVAALHPAATIARGHNISWALDEVRDRPGDHAGALADLHYFATGRPPQTC